MSAISIPTCFALALLAAGCQRDAGAQVPDDPLGPIRCFELVEARGLASTTALDLCTGATSSAPGQCFVAATDRHGWLTTLQIVRLCRAATSIEPVQCFERLDAAGTLTSEQILGYCATSCPMGPAPPEASDAGCFAVALERANLSAQMAGELCRNSRSAGPATCFMRGEDETALTESQLVQLCTHMWSCQYINVLPAQ